MEKYKSMLMESLDHKFEKSNDMSFDSYVKRFNKINEMDEDYAELLIYEIVSKRLHEKFFLREEDDANDPEYKSQKNRAYRKAAMSALGFGGSWVIYRTIRGAFDKCSAACGRLALNTPKRQICMSKCKVNMAKMKLDAAKKYGNPTQVKEMESKLKMAQSKYEMHYKKLQQKYKGGMFKDINPNPQKTSLFKIPTKEENF